LASEFPALPSSTAHTESTTRGNASQPHILAATAPKVTENKLYTKSEKRKDSSARKQSTESTTRVVAEEKKEEKREEKKPPVKTPTKSNSVSQTTKLADVPPPINVPATRTVVKEKMEKATPHLVKVSLASEPAPQAPLLSRQSKKEKKSKSKNLKTAKAKEEEISDDVVVAQLMESSQAKAGSEIEMVKSRTKAVQPVKRVTIEEILSVLDRQMQTPLDELSFFNQEHINPKSQTPLQYGPLVHALSALSVGGGTFSNSLPSRSIDTAVSSFQTLLETLTQTISDLLRLLPRTTWDDSASFDGVLRDMLKGDDFFDEPADEGAGKEDEVTALTQALERRARWMEVQLSKLEELHRDINTAAVRAVLTLNDRGWDQFGFLPRGGNSTRRFDNLVCKQVKGVEQFLSIPEMERKLERCLDFEQGAEIELRKSMDNLIGLKDRALDDWLD
jgi:CCR4-NOT transcription complex subunit 4